MLQEGCHLTAVTKYWCPTCLAICPSSKTGYQDGIQTPDTGTILFGCLPCTLGVRLTHTLVPFRGATYFICHAHACSHWGADAHKLTLLCRCMSGCQRIVGSSKHAACIFTKCQPAIQQPVHSHLDNKTVIRALPWQHPLVIVGVPIGAIAGIPKFHEPSPIRSF
jgi:hypothetical protein